MKAHLPIVFLLSLLIAGCGDSINLEDSQQNSHKLVDEVIATHGDNLLYFISFLPVTSYLIYFIFMR